MQQYRLSDCQTTAAVKPTADEAFKWLRPPLGTSLDPLPDRQPVTLAAAFIAGKALGEALWRLEPDGTWCAIAIKPTRITYHAHRYFIDRLPVARIELGRQIHRFLMFVFHRDRQGCVRGLDVTEGMLRDILLNVRCYAAREQEEIYQQNLLDRSRAAWRRPARAKGERR